MSLHVAVLGIDGSGKSTVAASLPALLAARLRIRVAGAGDRFRVIDPDQDLLQPDFHPRRRPLSAVLSLVLRRLAKRSTGNRYLYPAAKILQMVAQDDAAQRLGESYRADVVVSDGNTILSSLGRAANYLRPASRGQSEVRDPQPEDLRAALDFVLKGLPVPPQHRANLPNLAPARVLRRIADALRLRGVWVPDVAVFLDLCPKTALSRILERDPDPDRHENEQDLAQAREMYFRALRATNCKVVLVDCENKSPGEILDDIIETIRPSVNTTRHRADSGRTPLGTSKELTQGTATRRVVNLRYITRYFLPHFFRHAWREPLFFGSELGRLFLKQGYSAEVMRAIYDRDGADYKALDRVFLEYPLHRAVYDRLQLLCPLVEEQLRKRLQSNRTINILTAPSGFAYDLFRPLGTLGSKGAKLNQVRITACDLDPTRSINDVLSVRASVLGVRWNFIQGDLTQSTTIARLGMEAPFDMVLFVGLSSWLSKPEIVDYLCWVRTHLTEDGCLVTDSFTPAPYALSGYFVGYKANYYAPTVYKALLDYCGFETLGAKVRSGRDGINHVLCASPRNPSQPRF